MNCLPVVHCVGEVDAVEIGQPALVVPPPAVRLPSTVRCARTVHVTIPCTEALKMNCSVNICILSHCVPCCGVGVKPGHICPVVVDVSEYFEVVVSRLPTLLVKRAHLNPQCCVVLVGGLRELVDAVQTYPVLPFQVSKPFLVRLKVLVEVDGSILTPLNDGPSFVLSQVHATEHLVCWQCTWFDLNKTRQMDSSSESIRAVVIVA